MVQEYINFLDNITPLTCAFLPIYKFIPGETKLQKIYFLGKKISQVYSTHKLSISVQRTR